jgi:hypothetical protein
MMMADVVVLGAGSAGLAAAVSSARRGARTILVERHGFSGGMGTASLVHTFCGLYLAGGDTPVIANPGFPAEMERLMRHATGQEPVKMGRVWVQMQHPVDFASIADRLLREAGVEVLYHTEATALHREGDRWILTAHCRGGVVEISAATLVDVSGDAVTAGLLGTGAEMTAGSRLQRPAYVFGVRASQTVELGLTLSGHIVAGVRSEKLPAAAMGLHFRASGRAGEIFGTLDLSAQEEAYDPLDPACLSLLEIGGREIAAAVVAYLAQEVPGWTGAYVSQWPVRAGVRESRRWQGRAVLTGAEILAGARHADDIALATWPLEFRETNRGPKLRYAENDRPAGIPFGCLRPLHWDALFTAGRCLSCDHEAQASIRVMGTCFATGQAAGTAAALLARGKEPAAGLPGLEIPL